MKYSIQIKYSVNGKIYDTASTETEHFSLETAENDNTLTIKILPKTKLEISDFSLVFPFKYNKTDKIFVNGYQSWTDSLEYSPDGQMQELSTLTEFLIMKSPLKNVGFNKSGDNLFHKFPRQSGIFYGWSYGYVRNGSKINLFGSLSEKSGYTIITFDTNKDSVIVSKDLEGAIFTKETELLSFVTINDDYDKAFDLYFEKMGIVCRENKRRTGYTTWYNYYGNVNERVVIRDLNSISESGVKFDCFQIDDGYQNAIGDWLDTDRTKFPSGMKKIAERIHENKMLAGLWLAPFAGTKNSKLYKEHRDWFIKDNKGKPFKTGHNWGGFYSLDIYNPEVRDYLKHVFDVVLNDWGYDLVKLDFLYGACILPMHNKSRGEIMCDAMDFIRECCGDKLILGCGVPLMPAFGKVDYCRIGSDISLSWNKKKHIIREEVSTPHAVCNTIFRRHLDGRAWMNDPDVFLLRDSNNKMSLDQRRLVAKINSVCGSLLFVSDNVAEYSKEQLEILKDTFENKNTKIISAEFVKEDIIHLSFTENGKEKYLEFNAHTGKLLSFA